MGQQYQQQARERQYSSLEQLVRSAQLVQHKNKILSRPIACLSCFPCRRVLLGIGEGVAFPAIHSLLARNVPCTHQSAAVGVVTAAAYVGTAASFGLGPLIISNFGCWRPIFWLFSSLALAWLPMWLTIRVKNNVQQRDSGAKGRGHVAAGQTSSGADACTSGRIGGGSALASSSSPGITAAPAAATAVSAAVLAVPASVSAVPAVPPVVSGSGGGASSSGRDASISSGKGSAPALGRGFWALLKRREVWAICIAQYTWSWGMYSLLSWLPTFFADFYGVSRGLGRLPRRGNAIVGLL